MYPMQIISQHPSFEGMKLVSYEIGGEQHVGVFGDEPYAVGVANDSRKRVEVILSIDGTDIMTGKPASKEAGGPRWIVEPYTGLLVRAWPETMRDGARFVFGQTGVSVAAHTHGDLRHRGIIAAAIFEEGYVRPHDYSDYGPLMREERVLRMGGGPATGAGARAEQKLRSVPGLREPRLAVVQYVRYLWWDDLKAKLRAAGTTSDEAAGPPGFPGDKFAGVNLGSTPRPGLISGVREPARVERALAVGLHDPYR